MLHKSILLASALLGSVYLMRVSTDCLTKLFEKKKIHPFSFPSIFLYSTLWTIYSLSIFTFIYCGYNSYKKFV